MIVGIYEFHKEVLSHRAYHRKFQSSNKGCFYAAGKIIDLEIIKNHCTMDG